VTGAPLEGALRAYLRGDLAPAVTLLRALLAGAMPEAIRDAVDRPGRAARRGRPARRLAELRATLHAHWAGLVELSAMLREGAAIGGAGTGVERCAALFDAYVRRSEAASVAGYSLGSPALLAAATAETVALLERLGVLGPDRRILQVGCGTGRFEAALAGRVALAYGIDVAPGMIARARARCAGLSNVRLSLGSGRDLAGVADGSLDLVYGVDSFPYIHEAGLTARHVEEAARVLRSGGHLVILNLAYGRPIAVDRREVRALAARFGFHVRVNGAAPLRLWDARVFQLERRGGRGRTTRRPPPRPRGYASCSAGARPRTAARGGATDHGTQDTTVSPPAGGDAGRARRRSRRGADARARGGRRARDDRRGAARDRRRGGSLRRGGLHGDGGQPRGRGRLRDQR
jgi:SAM-dependent methyltransferase